MLPKCHLEHSGELYSTQKSQTGIDAWRSDKMLLLTALQVDLLTDGGKEMSKWKYSLLSTGNIYLRTYFLFFFLLLPFHFKISQIDTNVQIRLTMNRRCCVTKEVFNVNFEHVYGVLVLPCLHICIFFFCVKYKSSRNFNQLSINYGRRFEFLMQTDIGVCVTGIEVLMEGSLDTCHSIVIFA